MDTFNMSVAQSEALSSFRFNNPSYVYDQKIGHYSDGSKTFTFEAYGESVKVTISLDGNIQ